jgi:lipopolysaccharide/colanic/teichoic acid biosynthesis glycosyltransferase
LRSVDWTRLQGTANWSLNGSVRADEGDAFAGECGSRYVTVGGSRRRGLRLERADGTMTAAPQPYRSLKPGPADVDEDAIVIDLAGDDFSVSIYLVDGRAVSPRSFPFIASEPAPAIADRSDLRIVPRGGLLMASPLQLFIKRSVDLVASALLLLVLSPLMLAIAIAIKVGSRGPVLYRSRRIGKHGEPFTFWKFRSMYHGADGDRAKVAHLNEASGPVFKIAHDPRITPVGMLLRRSSLDELPQLLHVLSGKMSLVGPRPPLPDEVERYDARAARRLAVKPGLTCIWQVSGRSNLGFDQWVAMDIEYIENWTLRDDLSIMARTIPAVLTARGAY